MSRTSIWRTFVLNGTADDNYVHNVRRSVPGHIQSSLALRKEGSEVVVEVGEGDGYLLSSWERTQAVCEPGLGGGNVQ